MHDEEWPPLPLASWQDTYATLHMWMQVVGKIRLACTPLVNHWWNVPLYLSARGLTTSPMRRDGYFFEIEFDFVEHRLQVRRDDGAARSLPLVPRSVANFYEALMLTLDELEVPVVISTLPVEIPDPIPFERDQVHVAYDPEYARRCWRIMQRAAAVLGDFRARFIGKCSPVHFFWGSFDLAVSRFSGRRAPPRPEADGMTREAYSHEVISHGFWPGMRDTGQADGLVHEPAFYAYAAPEPPNLGQAPVRPAAAFYSAEMKEFILRYEDMRSATDPEAELMAFLESTYERAAEYAGWERQALERSG